MEKVLHNIKAHNKIAYKYAAIHGEIYNDFEQSRLRCALLRALSYVTSTSIGCRVRALDFGCGTGNITEHLAILGCDVTAADVSENFLKIIRSRRFPTEVKTVGLNGQSVASLKDGDFDFIALYSVLHHLPDYLSLIGELTSKLRPGGVIFIDHEHSQRYWSDLDKHKEINRRCLKTSSKFLNLKKYFVPRNYADWIYRKLFDPRYHREGDIHVFPDDHIEWDKLGSLLMNLGVKPLVEESYLLFRRGYDADVYAVYAERYKDMTMLIARKSV